MASAWHDSAGWIASFRAFRGTGRTKRRVRVPQARLDGAEDERDAALAFAAECDQYCRALEHAGAADLKTIRLAEQVGAITTDQAAALRRYVVPSADAPAPRPTIAQAARSHPSSQREAESDPEAAVFHEKQLADFATWAKVQHIDQVTLAQVQGWVVELRRRGLSWDGRRHALLWLRRATRMATQSGLPDVLGELQLDRRDRERGARQVQAWSLDELAKGWKALAKDPRAQVALALGGFLGLRPSETFRLRVGDVDLAAGLVSVGTVIAKNDASERMLPLPKIATAAISRLIQGRGAESPLLSTLPNRTARHRAAFTKSTFGHWLGPVLAEATGRTLPAKSLRKSFATWAFRAGLPPMHVEAMLGHRTALASLVTGRHYLADLAAELLRPTVSRIDAILAERGLQGGAT